MNTFTDANLLPQMEAIVRRAGEIVRSADLSHAGITEKSGANDLVTTYDVAVQEFLQKELQTLLPGSAFLGEETGLQPLDPACPTWIVDPIDGTTNFIKGYSHSAVSVALAYGGTVVAGVVYNPFTNELFSGQKGGGAFLNGKPIAAQQASLEHGITLFGSAPYQKNELADVTFGLLRQVFEVSMDIRRSGSAALDVCFTAAGRAAVYFEYRVCPWDYAAGMVIAQEAGALVTDLVGEPMTLDRITTICVAAPENHKRVLAMAAKTGIR